MNEMLTLDAALARLLAAARPIVATEMVSTFDAAGRVLAADRRSAITVPPHDNSSMDGYALRVAELSLPGDCLPVSQRIPAEFDIAPFVREARRAFMMLQAARDSGDVTTLRNFLTPELARELAPVIMGHGSGAGAELVELEVAVLEVVQAAAPDRWLATARYQGRVRREPGGPAQPLDEVWQLVKPVTGGAWQARTIQQVESQSSGSDAIAFEKVSFSPQSGPRS